MVSGVVSLLKWSLGGSLLYIYIYIYLYIYIYKRYLKSPLCTVLPLSLEVGKKVVNEYTAGMYVRV